MSARTLPHWPLIVRTLSEALDGAPPETLDLFDALFSATPPITSASALARRLGMPGNTLFSRFHRAGLPSPHVLIRDARLVRAAFKLDDPHRSGADVAHALAYSSPQAFARVLVAHGGVRRFRAVSGRDRLAQFVATHLTPHADAWRTTTVLGPRRFVPWQVAA